MKPKELLSKMIEIGILSDDMLEDYEKLVKMSSTDIKLKKRNIDITPAIWNEIYRIRTEVGEKVIEYIRDLKS